MRHIMLPDNRLRQHQPPKVPQVVGDHTRLYSVYPSCAGEKQIHDNVCVKGSGRVKKSPEGPNIPNCGRISIALFKKMETAAGFSAGLAGRTFTSNSSQSRSRSRLSNRSTRCPTVSWLKLDVMNHGWPALCRQAAACPAKPPCFQSRACFMQPGQRFVWGKSVRFRYPARILASDSPLAPRSPLDIHAKPPG
jgi:hypothetical protein